MINDRKSQLVEIIQQNPGLNFRDLMRCTNMKNGVLSFHLKKLEHHGSISVMRSPRQSRFFPPSFSDYESTVIAYIRRNTPQLIIHSLLSYDTLSFKEIVSHTKKSPSTVSLYLSQLVKRDKIVKTKLVDRVKLYCIKDKQTVDRLFNTYGPGSLDKPISGLEEIISSL